MTVNRKWVRSGQVGAATQTRDSSWRIRKHRQISDTGILSWALANSLVVNHHPRCLPRQTDSSPKHLPTLFLIPPEPPLLDTTRLRDRNFITPHRCDGRFPVLIAPPVQRDLCCTARTHNNATNRGRASTWFSCLPRAAQHQLASRTFCTLSSPHLFSRLIGVLSFFDIPPLLHHSITLPTRVRTRSLPITKARARDKHSQPLSVLPASRIFCSLARWLCPVAVPFSCIAGRPPGLTLVSRKN